ncbi:hypothetical protein NDR87_32460 [Nocardia sp. CDC159]|uniref:Uncharacterized protein n=1 Tax=Nocardia pulmonis TaxID=2951408 RepID=A0A9X2ED89_9NOCA|nr:MULTISPECIES: hypothetical protein [Nocardia]MCM6778206.1 hypothetical protein [Nocardia pulmonis]MCM6791095.1 hypothetical protein [Nocardia sp. CDC159]
MPSSPMFVRIAALGVGIHALNHLIVLLIPPVGMNPGTVYHLIGAPVYAALVLPLLRGRNWARILITVLLGFQFVGRFVVWALFPETGAHLALILGWTISIITLTLLWAPRASRAHFRSDERVGTPS